jgi:hypothetical protein
MAEKSSNLDGVAHDGRHISFPLDLHTFCSSIDEFFLRVSFRYECFKSQRRGEEQRWAITTTIPENLIDVQAFFCDPLWPPGESHGRTITDLKIVEVPSEIVSTANQKIPFVARLTDGLSPNAGGNSKIRMESKDTVFLWRVRMSMQHTSLLMVLLHFKHP